MRSVRVLLPTGLIEHGSVEDGLVVTESGTEIELVDEVGLELPEPFRLVRPLDPPEVWCSGVTYERSRDARIEESGSDVYARVYEIGRASCRERVCYPV